MDSMARDGSVDDAEKEILELEARLKAARSKLNDLKGHTELPAESLPSRGISSKPSCQFNPNYTSSI